MISVVIPTYNDEQFIARTITSLKENAYARLLKEIIVVDGGSNDQTVSEAEKAGATVIHSIKRNRSSLLNLGVEHTTGKILYFLSPGCQVPRNFTNEIVRATQKGYSLGAFSVAFDNRHWGLNLLNWFTQLKKNCARLEDQSLFVMRELFVKAGSFREDLMIMEDQEMISRLKRYSSFITLKETIVSSAKKYLANGILRSVISYLITWLMFLAGYPQEKLLKTYNRLMRKRKLTTAASDRIPQISVQQ